MAAFDHQATLFFGERRDVRPPAGKVQPRRGRGPIDPFTAHRSPFTVFYPPLRQCHQLTPEIHRARPSRDDSCPARPGHGTGRPRPPNPRSGEQVSRPSRRGAIRRSPPAGPDARGARSPGIAHDGGVEVVEPAPARGPGTSRARAAGSRRGFRGRRAGIAASARGAPRRCRPSASRSGATRAIGGRQRAGQGPGGLAAPGASSGGSGPSAGVPKPKSTPSTTARGSTAAATDRRASIRSNGGRRRLKIIA